ncbi:Phragmoplastin drp1c [Dionaea muscipula]
MKRLPSLQTDIATAANDALERFRDESRKTVLRLVETESSYLTVEFFRKLQMEPEKNGENPTAPNNDRYTDNHLTRIGNTCIVFTIHPS